MHSNRELAIEKQEEQVCDICGGTGILESYSHDYEGNIDGVDESKCPCQDDLAADSQD